jgi:hypothetical protein
MQTLNRRCFLQWSSVGLAAAALSLTEEANSSAVASDAAIAR